MGDIKKLFWMFGLGALFIIALAATTGHSASSASQPNNPSHMIAQDPPLFVNAETGDIVRLNKDGEVRLNSNEEALLPKLDPTENLPADPRGGGRGGGFHGGGFRGGGFHGGFRGGFHGRGWGRWGFGFYPYYPYYPYCNPALYPYYCY